ncbi:MAG: YceI family protein [Nitrosomonadales bacterium]|nr:YceI family protein [Nitrosomonadales bacterium]
MSSSDFRASNGRGRVDKRSASATRVKADALRLSTLRGFICAGSVLCFPLLPAGSHAAEFGEVQTGKSAITFAYKQMNVPMEGKFNRFSARLAFDPEKIRAAHARIEVELASIDTGFSESDDEVGGKLWFNTKAFPVAQFVSSGVKALGGNRYEALGKLSIKGRSLDVSAPFTFRQEGAVAVFEGTFHLKRLDYGIGEGIWSDLATVANEVQIRFHIVAAAATPGK